MNDTLRPPLAAIALGLAGLIPFVAGAATVHGLTPWQPFTGALILQSYGAIILSFMGGCLWGFAALAGRAGWLPLGVAVLPALWAFGAGFLPLPGVELTAARALALGLVALLAADFGFARAGLAPRWWLALRLPLTVVAATCLWLGGGV